MSLTHTRAQEDFRAQNLSLDVLLCFAGQSKLELMPVGQQGPFILTMADEIPGEFAGQLGGLRPRTESSTGSN